MTRKKDSFPAGSGTGKDAIEATASQRPLDRRRFVQATLTNGRRMIPRALPRLRFEIPADTGLDGSEAEETISDAARTGEFGAPGPRMSTQHPIYIGFTGAVGVGIALALYYVLTNTTQLLLWILTALFIALGLDPVVRWLGSHRVPRPAGIVILLAVLLGAVGGFFAILIPTLITQTTQLVAKAPSYANDFLQSSFFHTVDNRFHVQNTVAQTISGLFKNSTTVGGIAGGVLGGVSTAGKDLFGVLIVLVLSLYFLAALPSMKKWAYRLAPKSRRHRVELLTEAIAGSVGNYVIGQACVALLNATYAFIIMSILHVPFSVLLAFLVALLAFIPLVGSLIAGIAVALVAFTGGWQTAAIYALCYFAYLQVEAYFISPRVMQKAVAVPGAVAVISVVAGGSLLGILGALIAIPTAAAVLLLVKEIYIRRQDRH